MNSYVPGNPRRDVLTGKEGAGGAFFRALQELARELQENGVAKYHFAETVMTRIGVGRKEFASRLGVDPRTLTRFKKRGELNPAASDRLYRLARLLEAATKLHGGDEARAVRWLKTPNRALGDRRPIDMVATEPDFERILDLIGALEEGVFV